MDKGTVTQHCATMLLNVGIAVRFFREKYLKPHFGNVSWEGEL